jgi:hypothetical protein
MSCIPQSGGCEKPFTDVLVSHLNRTEGTHYMHRACLDVADSTTAQPEALYVDSKTGKELVIERKSVSWPVNYAYRHQNDHAVGEVFTDELRDLVADDLYEIRLPMLMEGKNAELIAYAKEATRLIRTHWSDIAAGSALKGRAGDKWWWVFRRLPEGEREDNAPDQGMMVSYIGAPLSFDNYLEPASLPEPLAAAINKIYRNVSAKFSSYQHVRRILLLDPHGDLQTENAEWWQGVFANLAPPPVIAEIWSGPLDWVTDEVKEWVFEQVYSAGVAEGISS